MSDTELQFRTATFGGFQKQDVLSYIESSNQAHAEKMEQLQRQRDELAREREQLSGQAAQAKAQAEQLAREKEQLASQLDKANQEIDRLHHSLEGQKTQLEQVVAQLADVQARLDRAEPDATAYQQVKDRTAGIELEAHCRAQEVQKAAEERVQRIHTDVEQWLHKVKAGYDLLRADMDSAIARTGQELDKVHQILDQLSTNFNGQEEHLLKLSQDCASEFAPPAPEPLPLNEK